MVSSSCLSSSKSKSSQNILKERAPFWPDNAAAYSLLPASAADLFSTAVAESLEWYLIKGKSGIQVHEAVMEGTFSALYVWKNGSVSSIASFSRVVLESRCPKSKRLRVPVLWLNHFWILGWERLLDGGSSHHALCLLLQKDLRDIIFKRLTFLPM